MLGSQGIRNIELLSFSKIIVLVERNLGFEAEHIKNSASALEGNLYSFYYFFATFIRNIQPGVYFYYDEQARRTGVLTTEKVKLGAMTLLNIMLREKRVHILPDHHFVSQDPKGNKKKLREQMEVTFYFCFVFFGRRSFYKNYLFGSDLFNAI